MRTKTVSRNMSEKTPPKHPRFDEMQTRIAELFDLRLEDVEDNWVTWCLESHAAELLRA